ncbi:MAG: NUDIX domain-containing protein [Candidatus Aminicenantes bacterium]|nr:NUDIX domain-containing protein [Candidatus Aminicenantes bacterium]
MVLPLLEFPVGSLWKRSQIHRRLGGNPSSGISSAAGKPYILIFSSPRGEASGSEDGWHEDGFFHFTGEGQSGDMKWVGGNKAIRDHTLNQKILLVFETAKDGRRRFSGPMSYVGHYEKTLPDRNGTRRKAIIFKLAKPNTGAVEEEVAAEAKDALRYAASRSVALKASQDVAEKVKTARQWRLRSRAVSKYVQERALGYCEVCGRGAPFETSSGKPYLECHHMTRLADDGPDPPRDVVAACPTCHRRIHHGADGAEIDRAAHERILRVEAAIEGKRLKVVTAAVIRDEAGRVLIAQRKHGHRLGSKWEFPGGTVEAGETLEECLEREIREELGIAIRVTGRVVLADHKYPTFDIRLCAMKASIVEGDVSLNDREKVVWVHPKELFHLDLAPADEHIVTKVLV